MIWVGGRIVEEDALKISVRDRTFEHGLGLFETLRTWNGRAPLLDRHLARMIDSAKALGIPLDPAALPGADAVAALLEANRADGDVLLRITLTGGRNEVEGSTLWMRTGPLPPPIPHEGAVVDLGSWRVVYDDPTTRHKLLNYWARREAYDVARSLDCDEVLSLTPSLFVWEGSRTNLFLVEEDRLVTPTLDGPIVPGVMRGLIIERASGCAMSIGEEEVADHRLLKADEIFLTNSVRGIIPVARIGQPSWPAPACWARSSLPAPGPWTQRLSNSVNDWLQERGGTTA